MANFTDAENDSASSPSTLGKTTPRSRAMASPKTISAQPSPSPSAQSSAYGHSGKADCNLAEPGEIWLSVNEDTLQLNIGPGAGMLTPKLSTVKKGENPWPVVICNEEMFRMLTRNYTRPQNARLPDGTWPRRYLPGGSKQGKVMYPTLILGVLTLCWTPWNRLEPIDDVAAYIAMDLSTDQQLRDAYTEAVEQYGRMDIHYWKDKLYARNLQRDEGNDEPQEKEEPDTIKIKTETEDPIHSSRRPRPEPTRVGHSDVVELKVEFSPKRKVSARGFIYPPVFDLPVDLDDDITMRDRDSSPFDGDICVNDDVKESPKRRKHNNWVAVSPHQQIKSKSSRSPLSQPSIKSPELIQSSPVSESSRFRPNIKPSDLPKSPSMRNLPRSKPSIKLADLTDNPSDPDTHVTVYVGNPHRIFPIKHNNLWHSPVLDRHVLQDPDIGSYVMLPLLLCIDADDFEVVAGLIRDASFICTDPLRIAKAYVIARKLEMEFIEQVCWRRFRHTLLEPPTKDLLDGIEAILGVGIKDQDIRWTLISYVAGHFWDVIRGDMGSARTDGYVEPRDSRVGAPAK